MAQVLMPIGDATEVMDTLYPFFRLPEDGFEVVVAGPEARLYHGVLHEIPPNENIPWDITRELPAYHVRATVAFRDVRPEDYVGLFLSGGRAPEYLRYEALFRGEQAHLHRLPRCRNRRGRGSVAGPHDDDRGQVRAGHHAVRRPLR
jgi:putative intracellular protease/amidase